MHTFRPDKLLPRNFLPPLSTSPDRGSERGAATSSAWGRWTRRAVAAIFAIVLVLGLATPAAAVEDPSSGTDRTSSPAQQLAGKHAPIVRITRQREPCGDGEPFRSAPVDVVLGDPAVSLRQDGPGEPVVTWGPTADDLFHAGGSAYLDLPGDPGEPDCVYERYFKRQMADHSPVAYARIAVDPFRPQLALQYWLYYTFNDANNSHEGDWEMIQLLFDATTVEEALASEPVQVAYAQHRGGEVAGWHDDKLERAGNRPLVYVAPGTHAAYFDSALYLGLGENEMGYGCDDTTGPTVRVPLEARLIPDDVADATGPFAWTEFKGRWGEARPGAHHGAAGPNLNYKWAEPFAWQRSLRDSSIEVPAVRTLGPAPTDVFCKALGFGSFLLAHATDDPGQVLNWNVLAILIAPVMLTVAGLFILGRRVIGAAWAIYAAHLPTFALLGLLLMPIGVLDNVVRYLAALVLSQPPMEVLFDIVSVSPGVRLALALTAGGLHHLIGLIFIVPAVIQAIATIETGHSP